MTTRNCWVPTAHVYLHARQVTGNEFFRTITEEILYYIVRVMTCEGMMPKLGPRSYLPGADD